MYIAGVVAAVIVVAAVVHSIASQMQISRLERTAAAQERAAAASEKAASAARDAAERYSDRAEYLEQQIGEIRALAARQDEEIKKLNTDTDTARGRVERSRGVRSIESTAAELCEKLADLGHGCEE